MAASAACALQKVRPRYRFSQRSTLQDDLVKLLQIHPFSAGRCVPTLAKSRCVCDIAVQRTPFRGRRAAMSPRDDRPQAFERTHSEQGRFAQIRRDYSDADVARLAGSIRIQHTLAELGARRLWELLHTKPYVACLSALTGGQAVQMVKAGMEAIYLSGWQVAADANLAGQTYPDQSLYPANSVPAAAKRINQALLRADQIHHMEDKTGIHWFAPIIADAEAGFGGPLNAF